MKCYSCYEEIPGKPRVGGVQGVPRPFHATCFEDEYAPFESPEEAAKDFPGTPIEDDPEPPEPDMNAVSWQERAELDHRQKENLR